MASRVNQSEKNEAAERRNTQALKDITNLVAKQAEYPCANVPKRITRSSFAQLPANGQAAAEKNKIVFRTSTTVLSNGVIAAHGVDVGNFIGATDVAATQKPPESEVIVISSDEDSEEEKKKQAATGRKTRRRPIRKNVKTFSSVLTARSKAACGLAYKPKDLVEDIDATDVGNELAAVEYIDDIYKFYKLTEDDSRVHDYMGSQPDINAKMRSILVDWLIEVHHKFELMPETLYLTINIVDRFLSIEVAVPRKELQLVGISSLLIACKYEEIWPPEVKDLACISGNAYAREQVLVMEKTILSKLDWYLTVPTPYVFLVRYSKASLDDKVMENMVFFLAELSLMHYSAVIQYCPSMIAASAVYAARCTLERNPFWTETLKHYTGYSEEQLRDCAKLMVNFHSAASESKLRAVHRKFCSPDRGAVALLTPAKQLSPQ